MWRLHRYYFKELAINASITFLVMFTVVLVSLVYRGIQRSQGGGLLDAAMITLFFALDALPHLVTIAFLIATVITFTRAAQDRELIAIRAAGLSPTVPMTSALLIGIFLSVAASFANHYIIPDAHFQKYRVVRDLVRSAIRNLGLDTDRIKILDSGYILTYRERSKETGEFVGCTLYSPRPIEDGIQSPIVFVDRVVSSDIGDKDASETDFFVQLKGVRDPINGYVLNNLDFSVPLDRLGSASGRDEKPDDVRSDQLLSEVMRGVHPEPEKATYTLFRRCCFALMPTLIGPIGFCIAEMARFRGRVFALVLALVPLVMFYLGEVLGARMLLSTNNPWCGWMPIVLLTAIGVPVVWRQMRR
ncbi:MAG: LptF/LptG family permease [Planctomycetota bacterium]